MQRREFFLTPLIAACAAKTRVAPTIAAPLPPASRPAASPLASYKTSSEPAFVFRARGGK